MLSCYHYQRHSLLWKSFAGFLIYSMPDEELVLVLNLHPDLSSAQYSKTAAPWSRELKMLAAQMARVRG